MPQAHYHHEPPTVATTTTDNDNDDSFHPVVTAMKELDTTISALTTASTTITTTTAKGNNSNSTTMLNNDGKQGLAAAAMLQSTRSASMCSAAKSETFEDMYDYECDNSSTSTGFDDHDDELEEDEEDDGEEQQEVREVDRRFHLRQHRLRVQHHYSDDEEEEEEKEEEEVEEAAESRETANTLDYARHHRTLEHSHGGDPAEEGGVQATTTITTAPTLVSSSSTADNCIDANVKSSSSSSHSVCLSTSDSPNPDAEDAHNDDGIHQNREDFSTPPPPPQPQSQQQQHIQLNSAIETSPVQHAVTTTAPSTTATPPELTPKSSSRPHLSIPRSIRFRASTSTDRLSSGAGSPLGRLQVHTVNRLEVENSFLLNQNNSLTRDIQHCRQTVHALKQILAQREDTIGRMKQEVHQAHLRIKFMESLLSSQRPSQPGQQQQQQQQQHQCSYQLQSQQQHRPRYQPQQQQEQHKGLESDWKERHRQNDDYDVDDDGDELEEEGGEGEGEEGGEEGSKGEERSSPLLDMYTAQDEPPLNWLLKGWDEGEMAAAEGSDRDSAAEYEDEDEDEDEEDRDIPRQVRSIFSGVNDHEQYNSDEYTDDDDEEYEDDEDERGRELGRVDKPRSGDFQGSEIYHHHNQQRPLSDSLNSSGESIASSLLMSLGNNSTCILTQENNNDHEDDDDDDEDACDTNDMNIVNGEERLFISGEHQSSSVSLPSPALSESSMSLELQSERSNGSVTSLSCSSLISTSTSTNNASADEKDRPPQQRQHESIEASYSSAGLSSGCGTDHQGLQLPTVVSYSCFRDNGHFATQGFTMDYEEQHLLVMDDTDMQDLESQSATLPFSPTTAVSFLVYKNDSDPMISSSPSSSSPVNKKGLSIEIGNGLTSVATALIQAKETSHHAPLCQSNGSHPCLGTSPPMSAPLALISRVHIETNASSTMLVSASTPSPTITTTMAAGGSIIAHGKLAEESPSAKEIVVTAGVETSEPVDREVAADSVVKKGDLGGDDVVQLDGLGSSSIPSTPTTPTTSAWGPSSLLKGLLPSKRKNKSRSSKSKDRSASEVDGRLSPEGDEVLITRKEDDVVMVVVKEQSVAWTMLKNQSSRAIEPPAAVEREASPPASIVAEPTAAAAAAAASSSTLFSRVFGGRSNRTKT